RAAADERRAHGQRRVSPPGRGRPARPAGQTRSPSRALTSPGDTAATVPGADPPAPGTVLCALLPGEVGLLAPAPPLLPGSCCPVPRGNEGDTATKTPTNRNAM